MPLKSMTGYGAARFSVGENPYKAELRSVNHRSLDLKPRISRELRELEGRVREAVGKRVARGHLQLSIESEGRSAAPRDVAVDKAYAAKVYDALLDLRNRLGIAEPVSLDQVLAFDGVIASVPQAFDADDAWGELSAGLAAALDDHDGMRVAEGAKLEKDLRERVVTLGRLAAEIRTAAPAAVEEHKARVTARLAELAAETSATWRADRVEAEIALLADRTDITEELIRIDAHLGAVDDLLDAPLAQPVGRKLEFIAIELNREFNTIGSKSSSTTIAQRVIDAKAEVERIREQVANIE